jgi:hypothetical protein
MRKVKAEGNGGSRNPTTTGYSLNETTTKAIQSNWLA